MREEPKPAFLRRAAVEKRTGLSRSGIYAAMKAGEFPKPVKLFPKSVAWVESEITEWINSKIAASRGT